MRDEKVEEALDYLFDFDCYSKYNEQLSIVYDYIEELEKKLNEIQINSTC